MGADNKGRLTAASLAVGVLLVVIAVSGLLDTALGGSCGD